MNLQQSEKKVLEKIYQIILDHKINLTEDDVLNFLQMRYRWPINYPWGQPSVEIISEFGGNSTGEFFTSSGKFLFDTWKKYYDLGFTTILSNVLDLTPELRSLSDKIFYYTGSNINGNFYLSKGSSDHRVSFPPHTHDYNVIVKPIYGDCKWKLGEEVFKNPQQSFMIPAGMSHCVYECLERKLSLTLNII